MDEFDDTQPFVAELFQGTNEYYNRRRKIAARESTGRGYSPFDVGRRQQWVTINAEHLGDMREYYTGSRERKPPVVKLGDITHRPTVLMLMPGPKLLMLTQHASC